VKAPNNSEILDTKLASANQQAIQKVVQQLPEDSLSLAWRSALNERLIAESVSHKPRFRFSWFAMPAAGVAMAAALAVVVFFHAPTSSSPQLTTLSGTSSGSVEMGLLDAYRQESVSHEIIGAGPDPSVDASRPSMTDVALDSYSSEVDPDSL